MCKDVFVARYNLEAVIIYKINGHIANKNNI